MFAYPCNLSDLSVDYSTDAFLMSFRRFESIRGCSRTVFSDSGSQLVVASKELKEMFTTNLDWNKIRDYSSSHGTEWKFSPGEVPWCNGCCEALIRSVKKSIMIIIGNEVVTRSMNFKHLFSKQQI